MNAFRLLIAMIVLGRLPAPRRDARIESPFAPFDAARLATQPLPAGLRLYRHPREITPERVRSILGDHIER